MKIIKPSCEILTQIDSDVLRRLEQAGRTAYKSEDKITDESAAPFVRKIIASGHESVLEHESVSVRIVCDRGVSHEIVRHRLASYTQESTRYCDYGKQADVAFIQPPLPDESAEAVWRTAMRSAEQSYLWMRAQGISPQIARSVLPNSLKTEIVMTANLREWRHFFKLRTAAGAHPQMRELAVALLGTFKRLIPAVFDDIDGVPYNPAISKSGSSGRRNED